VVRVARLQKAFGLVAERFCFFAESACPSLFFIPKTREGPARG
jgi:hypothetical protein